jgi:hypothetical protein
MPDYLVTAPFTTDWHEDPAGFAAALEQRWPGAKIKEDAPDSPIALDFTFEEDGELVLGSLFRDGRGLSLSAGISVAAKIAAWWRERVPDDVPLVFYDEGYNADVPVPPGADPAEVAEAYLAAANG